MFVKPSAVVRVNAILRRGFAEVHFDRAHTHLQKIREFVLIPSEGFWIRKIENGILIGQISLGIADHQIVFHKLVEQ